MRRRQIFRAPGTWNNPGTVTEMQVLVVGGGGGGGTGPSVWGHGGGGGVKGSLVTIPTSPVPITVGAGGTGGNKPAPDTSNYPGTLGGTTSFGPPAAPWQVTVDGGGAGGGNTPTNPTNAPPNGGGGGLGGQTAFPIPLVVGTGLGGLGYNSTNTNGGAGNQYGFDAGGMPVGDYNKFGIRVDSTHPYGLLGFGGGGNTGRDGAGFNLSYSTSGFAPSSFESYFPFFGTQDAHPAPVVAGFRDGKANTGGGGAGSGPVSPTTTAQRAGDGGSGIVILEWWE